MKNESPEKQSTEQKTTANKTENLTNRSIETSNKKDRVNNEPAISEDYSSPDGDKLSGSPKYNSNS